ncbi:MAG: hypothetical protein ACT4QF_09235 [Sporichthyaceae bacterium]
MSMDASRSGYGAVGMAAVALTCASAAVVLGFRVPATASAAHQPSLPPAAAPAGQDAPRFVDPAAMPQGDRFGHWGATAVRAGLPKATGFCLNGIFDAAQTSHRAYKGAAPKVNATQYIVQAAGEPQATALVAKLGKRLEGCYREWLNLDIDAYENAPRTASWQRYRTSGVADGLTVYGVFTVPPKQFDKATHLYGVGRDGDRVTVLHLTLVGSQSQAPDTAFRKSATHALRIVG